MTTIKAEEVRIPRRAREAVARHEQVVVVNRERPAYVIVHPDDRAVTSRCGPPAVLHRRDFDPDTFRPESAEQMLRATSRPVTRAR